MNDKSPDECTVGELREDFLKHVHEAPKFFIWWMPVYVWLLARTWWRLKFWFDYHFDLPFRKPNGDC